MSYRTRANDFQIFENNGYCGELIDELKRQGMDEPNDGFYSFRIKDINPIIKIIDKYIEEEIKEREKRGVKMYDFKNHSHVTSDYPLHLKVTYLIEDAWLFQSYNFVNYLLCTGCIKRVDDRLSAPVYEIKKPITISAG